MPTLDDKAVALVSEVKTALTRATPQLAANGLKVESVRLDLEASLEVSAGGKVSLFKILTLEAKHTRAETQTICITLKPPTADREAFDSLPGIGDTLQQAIVVIAAATKEAAETEPALELTEAEVTLEIAVTNDGSIEVFVEGSGVQGNTHRLTIGLAALED
jgi:NTP-dependent ternary system trypsin peptidase co-occuring protein